MSSSLRPRFFGETNIFNIQGLSIFQIRFGCKSAVESHVQRVTTIDFVMAFQHFNGQIRVRRIAFNNPAVADEIGWSTGQADFVAIIGVSPVLFYNVGMRLKDRDDFFCSRNLFIEKNSPSGLIDNPFGKGKAAPRNLSLWPLSVPYL